MKVLLISLKYMHQPELVNLSTVKNNRIHFNALYLRKKLKAVIGRSLKFPEIVQKSFKCSKKRYEELEKTDKFVNGINLYYDNCKDGRRREIVTSFDIEVKLKLDAHIDILTATLHKRKIMSLSLKNCNMNDFFFSKLHWTDFSDLFYLNLDNNHLTNHSIKNMTKMNFSKEFIYFYISMNNLNEDAIKMVFNSKVFGNLEKLSIKLKDNRKRSEKVPLTDILNIPKLTRIVFDKDALSFGEDFISAICEIRVYQREHNLPGTSYVTNINY